MGTKRKRTKSAIDGFEVARADLAKKWPRWSEAPQHVQDEISKATHDRLLDDGYVPAAHMQKRVIKLVSGLTAYSYQQIAQIIAQEDSDAERILRDFAGHYRYFRFFEDGVMHDWVFTGGTINIFSMKGVPMFSHRSNNAPDDVMEEHRGFVYLCDNNLFMLGYRERALRLAIAHIGTERDRYWGVVNSVKLDLRYPFGARFLMVHSRLTGLIDRLSSSDGQKLFEEMSKKDQAFYLRGV